MKFRSLLFVPGDRPERFVKAADSGADAIIIDLEDSVALPAKAVARGAAAAWLSRQRPVPTLVRVNPIDSGMIELDLAAVLRHRPDGIMLPKAEGAETVRRLVGMMPGAPVPILPIATETPAAMFELGSYAAHAERLLGLTWGAEDLPAAIGAETGREADGRFTAPVELARSLTLFGAAKAGIAPIETVYPAINDLDGLAAYAARGRRDGFTGMMAIHPAQVPVINAAFTPSDAQVAEAQAIVAAFAANPHAGVLQVGGRMVDAPHLKSAQSLLVRAGDA